MNGKHFLLNLLLCIVICQLAGFIGSQFTRPAIPAWYENLNQPSFRPPNWVFAPVWITLYLLMGISAALVWNKVASLPLAWTAFSAFGLQLLLNVLWSAAFFGLRSPLAGMVVILPLLAAILWMIAAFHGISPAAAYLQIPYALWVAFASVLNLSFVILNR